MKKGMFFALAASSLLFSACSSDDAVVSTEGQNEAVQQIVLHVASSGDGLTTRAGRPLYSSQALQTIKNVRVLIYKNETGGGEKTIVYDKKLNWKESTIYKTNGHGRQFTISLKGNDRLDAGNYKIMAVGYSDNSDYTYALDVTSTEALTGGTYNDITATLKAGKKDAEEVFAGDATLTIGDDKKITNLTQGEDDGVAVTLHRQVAGSFGYFCNIPASVNGKAAATLRLVVRDKNDKLTFNHFNSSFTANGATGSTIQYYVNGSKSTSAATADAKFYNNEDGYVLYSIDLSKWFTEGDKNKDGLLNAEDTWQRPSSVKTQVVKGSVFGSNFVIPFNYAEGKSTMELQLLDNAGDIIKTWTVSIPEVNSNTENGNVADATASIFNVVRNHMYNLGVKTSNGTTTPPDPSNPDPDPNKPDPDKPDPGKDEPEDLTKSQNLILKVNDNWEAIHKLVLGD